MSISQKKSSRLLKRGNVMLGWSYFVPGDNGSSMSSSCNAALVLLLLLILHLCCCCCLLLLLAHSMLALLKLGTPANRLPPEPVRTTRLFPRNFGCKSALRWKVVEVP
jgi:hypothetical protein